MAGSAPTQLPAYISLRYEENGVFDRFSSEAERAAAETKKRFGSAFAETEKVVQGAVGRMSAAFGKIDLGVGQFREQAAQVRLYRESLAETERASKSLAERTGDTSVRTREYIRALSEQRAEADRVLRSTENQITTYSRLQGALDGAASKTSALARAQREVYAEQARAAREEVSARDRQNLYATGFGIDRPAKSARDSASVFENQSYKPSVDLRDAVQRIRDGDAAMDRAAVSGTTLEQVLGRVAGKSRQVAAAVGEQARVEKEAAADTARLAQAVDRLHAEVDDAIAAQQRYASQVRLLDDALAKGAIDAERYATIHSRLSDTINLGTTSTRSLINSQGALRQATLQSGQQLQDIVISLYSGQQASIVFAQQLPQLAFGLSGLEGSANKTHDRIGRFATFLSGPWGIAVGLAVGVAGSLIAELLDVGDEAEKANTKTYDFTRTLDVMALKGNAAADAMRQLAAETRNAITEQGDYLNQQSDVAQESIAGFEKRIAANRKLLAEATRKVGGFGLDITGAIYNTKNISRLQGAIRQDEQDLATARLSAEQADLALSQRRVTVETNASAAATIRYNEAVGLLNIERKKAIKLEKSGDPLAIASSRDPGISKSDYEKRLKNLQGVRDAAIKAAQDANNKTRTLERAAFGLAVTGSRVTGRVGEQRPGHQHAGLDIAVPVGTQVRAPQAGTIIEAGKLGAYGNVVFIDHGGGTISRLAHLSKIGVTKGQVVTAGEQIGLSGGAKGAEGSGRSTGPHLHQELRVNGKAVDPRGSYAIDALGATAKGERLQEQARRKAEAAAEALKREQEELAQFGDRSAESILRLNERFNEQPRLVDQADAATRQLNKTIAELGERKPAGFEQMIADAETAKGVVQDALVRPFREMAKDAERRVAIQTLLAKGQQDEADALSETFRFQDLLGPLTQAQVDNVRDLVLAEKDRTRELEVQRQLFEAQLDVLDDVKRDLTSILSGRKADLFGNLKQGLADIQGQRLFENIFGDAFRDIEDELRGKSPLGKESQRFASEMSVATNALDDFTASLTGAANAGVGGAANDNGPSAAFLAAFGDLGAGKGITVNGTGVVRKPEELAQKSIKELADRFSDGIVDPLLGGMSDILGTELAQQLGGIMKGAISGYARAGKVGAVIGGAQSIVDQTGLFNGQFGEVSYQLGNALDGAQKGSQIAGIAKGLGIKTSTTGSQLGGAAGGVIGDLTGIPGLDIAGGILGGLLGGLFKKTKKGYANNITVTDDGTTNYSTAGNSASRKTAAGGLADSLGEALNNIADELGGGLNSSLNLGSLGMRKDKYTFDPTPGNSAGRLEFDSEEEATRAALEYAINQGVVTGIRASTQKILSSGKDLDRALQDALTFENAFKELKALKDPIGAALDELDDQFKGLIDIATAASASSEEMAQLEELYGLKRNQIVKDQAQELVGSLKSLLDDLTTGDMGLSLRDRDAAAQAIYDPLKARVVAGDTTAYDDYAEAAQNLLAIERERYGSQQAYFDRLDEVTKLTRDRVAAEANVVSIAENRDSPFDSAGKVKDSIVDQTAVLGSHLDAVNQNIGATNERLERIEAAILGGNTGRAINFASTY